MNRVSRTRRLALVAAALALGASATLGACGTQTSHVYVGRQYDPSFKCFGEDVSIDVVYGPQPGSCPPICIMSTFDEAGMMLKDEATAEFMEYCFRTLRKTGVAVCAISQGLEDFLTHPRARNAFVGAADNLFVLKQDNTDKARLIAREKNLSEPELRQIQAVTTVPGSHAEFLLIQMTPHGQRTLHLVSGSTPLKYAFTANSPEDRRALRTYQEGGRSRPDAVRQFARDHPRGIVSSRLLSSG